MTKIKLIIISALFLMGAAGCSESFLDQEPENVIPESMIYEDKELVLSVLSNLYDRIMGIMEVTTSWTKLINVMEVRG